MKKILIILLLFTSTELLAHDDSCLVRKDSLQNESAFRVTYEISCKGYYTFFMSFKFKDRIERRVKEGSNKYVFYDPNDGGKEVAEKIPLNFTKKIFVDGEKVEEVSVNESVTMGQLGFSFYTFKKGLLAFNRQEVTVEIEIYDSESFLDKFDVRNVGAPRIRHLFSLLD